MPKPETSGAKDGWMDGRREQGQRRKTEFCRRNRRARPIFAAALLLVHGCKKTHFGGDGEIWGGGRRGMQHLKGRGREEGTEIPEIERDKYTVHEGKYCTSNCSTHN